MADANFDIAIRFITQHLGPEKAQEVLKKVREETAKLQQATTEEAKATDGAATKTGLLSLKKAELKKLVGELKREFPLLGEAMKLALDPRLLAITLLIKSFQVLSEQIKRTSDLLNPSEWRGRADAIGAGKRAFEDATIAANLYWHELNRAASEAGELTKATNKTIEAINHQSAAEQTIIDAEEKAGRLNPEQATARRNELKDAEAKQVLSALQAEREQLRKLLAQQEKSLPGAQMAGAAASAGNVEIGAEREILAGNVASSNAKIAAYEQEFEARSKFGMRSAIYDKLTDADVRQAMESEIAARDKAKGLLDRFNKERAPMEVRNGMIISDAAAAERNFSAGRFRLSALDEQIGTTSSRNFLDQRTRSTVQLIEAGLGDISPLLPGAGAAATAIRAGGRAQGNDAQQFNQLIAQLESARKMERQQIDAFIQAIAEIFQDGVVSKKEMEDLKRIVRNNNQRV